MKKPPLTPHAISLPEYPDLESVFADYAKGCPKREPRVFEAVLATVGSAFRRWDEYAIPLDPYLGGLGANRLAFAALLVVRATFAHAPFHKTALGVYESLREKITQKKEPYPFVYVETSPYAAEWADTKKDAAEVFLRASVCPTDFLKQVPWDQDWYVYPEEKMLEYKTFMERFAI